MPYELTKHEQRRFEDVVAGIEANGGLFRTNINGDLITDGAGQHIPLDFVVLPGRKYLVDRAGLIWRFRPEGLRTIGGPPRKNNAVEMWSGKWIRQSADDSPDGKERWIKRTIWRPVDRRIMAQMPSLTQIEYYQQYKGYKHPLDPPDEPTEIQIKALEATAGAKAGDIMGMMQRELSEEASKPGSLIDEQRAEEVIAEEMAVGAGRSNKRS